MRPYIFASFPSPPPLLCRQAKERGPGGEVSPTIAQNGDERYRSPPFFRTFRAL